MSRTGPRKIDEMRDKLSRLRRQNDMETEKIALFEGELLDEESSAKQVSLADDSCSFMYQRFKMLIPILSRL
jgi:hypothetical protein